jgi:type VI secretion system protein VasG
MVWASSMKRMMGVRLAFTSSMTERTRFSNSPLTEPLKNVVIRGLDMGLLQAGASVKGEFENRVRSVMDEVKASLTPIILFIDEAHTMIGAGGQAGQSDAANLLKPALARGELRTIAATTWSEYKKYFEKDAALARRFQVVKIEEPSEDSAIQMMRAIAVAMEAHHKVRILDEAVVDAVKLSNRYISGRQLPDKCVSVLDTACARVALSQASTPAAVEDLTRLLENIDREVAALEKELEDPHHAQRIAELQVRRGELEQDLQKQIEEQTAQTALVQEVRSLRAAIAKAPKDKAAKPTEAQVRLRAVQERLRAAHKAQALIYECVDGSTVAEVISGWTGIPLGRMVADEIGTIRNLKNLLEARVIGQTYALELIARHIQIARANLEDPGKPKGVFLLVGPSGVGKTETALALVDVLYGGERNLISINMSEYQEAHTVSGLKGSPPGYVGYGEGGVLTEAVRRKPYSVVLLDEVEKAHPDVLELFYQVFDKGLMEDAEGREIDFRNTIIILTSNIGSELVMRAVEHGVKEGEKTRQPTPQDLVEILRATLQKAFKPAFLGRLSVVPYYPVQDEILKAIIRLKLEKICRRIEANHAAVMTYDDAMIALMAERCTEVESGARNADAIISNLILSELSSKLLERMAEGRKIKTIAVKLKKGKVGFQIA